LQILQRKITRDRKEKGKEKEEKEEEENERERERERRKRRKDKDVYRQPRKIEFHRKNAKTAYHDQSRNRIHVAHKTVRK